MKFFDAKIVFLMNANNDKKGNSESDFKVRGRTFRRSRLFQRGEWRERFFPPKKSAGTGAFGGRDEFFKSLKTGYGCLNIVEVSIISVNFAV